jgi:hypothetical protein
MAKTQFPDRGQESALSLAKSEQIKPSRCKNLRECKGR